ncbi:MAG: ABC transporter permease [Bdellovibrio sp.]
MKIVIRILDEIGENLLFLQKIGRALKAGEISSHMVFEQIWKVTVASAGTTALAGFFVGAIMAVQFTLQMKEFGALGYLGGVATSATIREIGPLLIAFMLSGKVGAFTSAELGTMRVTEQLDAIRCLGADPLKEIVVPRFIAIVVASFFLLGAGLIMSIGGGLILGNFFSRVHWQEYIRHIPQVVHPASLLIGLIKCVVFAIVLGTICTYKGYTASGGAKGVGRAVVSTAVVTMICIVFMDWLTSFVAEMVIQSVRGFRA